MTYEQYDLLDPTFAWLWDPAAERWIPFRLKATPGCVPHFRVPVADVRRLRRVSLLDGPLPREPREDCERTLQCTGGVESRPVLIDGKWREGPHHCTYVEDPRSEVLQAKMDALEQYTIESERARVAEEASLRAKVDHEIELKRAFDLLRAEGFTVYGNPR